jgi:hypothetical protein
MPGNGEPANLEESLVLAELVEEPQTVGCLRFGSVAQARLMWLVALVLLAATLASAVLLADSAQALPIAAVLTVGVLLALAWSAVLLFAPNRPRGVTIHAVFGILLNCLVLFVAVFIVIDTCVLHAIGPATARVQEECRDWLQSGQPGTQDQPEYSRPPPPPYVTVETQTTQTFQWDPLDAKPQVKSWSAVPPETTDNGVRIKTLDVGPAKMNFNCEWSTDGKRAFVFDDKGSLVELSIPDCRVLRTLPLPEGVCHVVMSEAGLVLADSKLANVLLVDPDTLEGRRIPLPVESRAGSWSANRKANWIAGAPASSVIFATTRQRNSLWIMDLANNTLVTQPLQGVAEIIAASADGRYLICYDGQRMHRLSVEGTKLTYEEMGAGMSGYYPTRIAISNDSKYVALICSDGNRHAPSHPAVPNPTYVYEIGKLSEPVVAIPDVSRDLAWDHTNGRIYAHDRQHPLVIFGPEGGLERSFTFPGRQHPFVWRLRVHPGGNKLLVLTYDDYYWVDLSESDEAR